MHTTTAALSLLLALTAGCASPPRVHTSVTFETVHPVLETTCLHCHGTHRLQNMPALTDTLAIARLIGPGKLIVPGHPEQSRFFQVVSFTDTQPGAMPPTGHAISHPEMEKLRAWIAAGAPLPGGSPILLVPRGEAPRSR